MPALRLHLGGSGVEPVGRDVEPGSGFRTRRIEGSRRQKGGRSTSPRSLRSRGCTVSRQLRVKFRVLDWDPINVASSGLTFSTAAAPQLVRPMDESSARLTVMAVASAKASRPCWEEGNAFTPPYNEGPICYASVALRSWPLLRRTFPTFLITSYQKSGAPALWAPHGRGRRRPKTPTSLRPVRIPCLGVYAKSGIS